MAYSLGVLTKIDREKSFLTIFTGSDFNYAQHLHPKKRSHSDPPPFPAAAASRSATTQLPTTTYPTHVHPMDHARIDIDSRFEAIRNEINNQHIFNTQVVSRISKLEITSINIDSKVDKIISHLEQALPYCTPNKKRYTSTYDHAIAPMHVADGNIDMGGNSPCFP